MNAAIPGSTVELKVWLSGITLASDVQSPGFVPHRHQTGAVQAFSEDQGHGLSHMVAGPSHLLFTLASSAPAQMAQECVINE